MAIVRWQPVERGVAPVRRYRSPIDWLLEDVFYGWPSVHGSKRDAAAYSYIPDVEVKETTDAVVVKADLPGVDKEDVSVTATKDVLTIKGERKELKESEGESCYCRESSYGSFLREIPLPVEVKTDQVTAKLVNGVLTVTLPKSSGVAAKTVSVTAN